MTDLFSTAETLSGLGGHMSLWVTHNTTLLRCTANTDPSTNWKPLIETHLMGRLILSYFRKICASSGVYFFNFGSTGWMCTDGCASLLFKYFFPVRLQRSQNEGGSFSPLSQTQPFIFSNYPRCHRRAPSQLLAPQSHHYLIRLLFYWFNWDLIFSHVY